MLDDKRKYIYNIPDLKYKRQYLRNNATPTEQILWQELKNSKLGYKFRRQFSVKGFILDFYCPNKRLAIELDGRIHNFKTKYDRYRDQYLEAMVIKTIRFTNDQIENNLEKVLASIKSYLTITTPLPPPT